MANLTKSSAVSFSILTILFIPLIFVPTVFCSIDDNQILLPSDRKNNDHSICPNVNDQVSCPVKCFTTDPVCGEDGVTYWCGCADAHCAGTRVAKLGFCQVGNGGAGPVSGQAHLLVHIVWLILLGFFVLFGLL